jgi:opacity protein-like surface antigen
VGPALLYATGGLGLGGASLKASAHGFGTFAFAEANVSLVGSVFGAGVEARATEKISIRAEVLHYAFTRSSINGVVYNEDLSATVLRTGVSLRFN